MIQGFLGAKRSFMDIMKLLDLPWRGTGLKKEVILSQTRLSQTGSRKPICDNLVKNSDISF